MQFYYSASNYQAALDASEIPLLEAPIPEYPARYAQFIDAPDVNGGES